MKRPKSERALADSKHLSHCSPLKTVAAMQGLLAVACQTWSWNTALSPRQTCMAAHSTGTLGLWKGLERWPVRRSAWEASLGPWTYSSALRWPASVTLNQGKRQNCALASLSILFTQLCC